jgi:hypothetical protein
LRVACFHTAEALQCRLRSSMELVSYLGIRHRREFLDCIQGHAKIAVCIRFRIKYGKFYQ